MTSSNIEEEFFLTGFSEQERAVLMNFDEETLGTALAYDDDGTFEDDDNPLSVDEDFDIEFDDEDEDSEGSDDEDAEALDVPGEMVIIEQIVRTAPDGNQVVDIVIEVEDIEGAANYEVRVSK